MSITSGKKREIPREVSFCDTCLNDYRDLKFDESLEYESNFYPIGTILWRDEHPYFDGRFGPYVRHESAESRVCINNAQLLAACRDQIWILKKLKQDFQPYWNHLRQVIPNWPGF